MAAVSIREALLLAMNDHKLLPGHEIMGAFLDAAAEIENASGPDAEADRAVAALIHRVISGGDCGRRP